MKATQNTCVGSEGLIGDAIAFDVAGCQCKSADLPVPREAALDVVVFVCLRNVRNGLRAGAERPPVVRGLRERLRMMRVCLRAGDCGMTGRAGFRAREILRREQQKRERYQVKRPLYWNWRPR